MSGSEVFLNKNKELSVGKVLFGLGAISTAVVLAVAWLQAYVGASTTTLVAFSLAGGGLVAALVYVLIVQPLLRSRSAAPAAGAEVKSLLTTIDPITRTLNRRGVTSSVLEAMAQAQRYGTPLSIAAVTVDGFIQAKHAGPAARDSVLQLVAHTITEVLRLPDRVGRQDDAEFLVVMPQTKAPAAMKVAERIRAAVEKRRAEAGDTPIALTVSIGVTEFRKGQDLEKLLDHAQRTMRTAHEAGGNQVLQHKAERARRTTS